VASCLASFTPDAEYRRKNCAALSRKKVNACRKENLQCYARMSRKDNIIDYCIRILVLCNDLARLLSVAQRHCPARHTLTVSVNCLF